MSAPAKKTGPLKVAFTLLYILSFPALLLFLSGDWCWTEGWIFGGWFAVLCSSTILYLFRKDPALLEERYKQPGAGNQPGWDKFVVYALFLGFISWIVLMPLDAKRYAWSPHLPVALKIAGGVLLLISFFFFFRSFTDNTFLSPLVRVQSERKQQVVTTGVYGFVRHPMYLGGILMFIGAPLLMGSLIATALGLLLTLLMTLRTLGEEKMLLTELEGYEAYKQKVKYRFVPFIW